MESWFLFTLAATILYGVMYFVQKSGANRGYSSAWIVNISTTSVAVLAVTAALFQKDPFRHAERFVLFAAINGTFFMLGSLIRFRALKILPSAIAFPIGKINVLFTAVSGILIFGERLTISQGIAFGLFFGVVWLLSRQEKHQPVKHLLTGIFLSILASLSTAISVTTGKFAANPAEDLPMLTYMALSYMLVSGMTFLIGKVRAPADNCWKNSHALKIGVTAGVCNFAGYFCILKAFSTGKLSVIHPIFSLSIVIPIVLAVILHGEKMTWRKSVALVLALLAVILMKLDLAGPLFSGLPAKA